MGNEFSVESFNAEQKRKVESKELLERNLPATYNESIAKEIEDFIVTNRKSLHVIELTMSVERRGTLTEVSTRYLDVVLRGLNKAKAIAQDQGKTRDSQGNRQNRDHRNECALDELKLYSFKFDTLMLSRLIGLAPRTLELCGTTIHNHELDGTPAANVSWKDCEVEELDISTDMDTGTFVSTLDVVSTLSSLSDLNLSVNISDAFDGLVDTEDSRDAIWALVSVLESNSSIDKLRVNGFFPEKNLFCPHLARNESITHMDLRNLSEADRANVPFFEAMAAALRTHNTMLGRLEYEDSSSGWGPSSIGYYVQLNNRGRRKLNSDALRGSEIVDVLKPFCGTSHAEFVRKETARFCAMSERERNIYKCISAFATPWAYSEEEWQLKNTCMAYGLLRRFPGGWSKAAAEAASANAEEPANKKPAASISLPPTTTHKEKGNAPTNTSSSKKRKAD